jgi:AraC-like DNA-binding protein
VTKHYEPNEAARRRVGQLAGHGVTPKDIARATGVSERTLQKHYRNELDCGAINANAAVAGNLFRIATGDGPRAVAAAIFILKARAGWKEERVNEPGGSQVVPIKIYKLETSL